MIHPVVRRIRSALATTAVIAGLLWGVAAATVAVAAMRLIARDATAVGVLLGVVALAVSLWRWRWLRSPLRTALWLEERRPELKYALVTSMEPEFARLRSELDGVIAATEVNAPLLRAARRSALPALGAALGGVALLTLLSSDAVAARTASAVGIRTGVPGATPALSNITVTVRPPAYAGQSEQRMRDPETIRALVGSRISLRATSSAAGIAAGLGDEPLAVSGDPWQTGFTMPATPRALRITDSVGGAERVIVVEPVRDEPPRGALTAPARDTLLRSPPAEIRVSAEVSDDIGLADAAIEYLISSGQEETYTARTGTVDSRRLSGERTVRLLGTLSNSTLRLGPGDVLSIRAVARDRNSVSGPGVGASETRTIRIARSDEDDSVSVEAIAPTFGDSALLSQRMILMRTEALVRALPGLPRDSVVSRATAIAFDQERLRNRVHSLVFPGHEHADESPMAGEPPDHAEPPDPVNVDLKVAYEAMWEAGRELRIASPQTAVPPMRVAVAALDRARLANRLYLRGATPRVALDLEEVRLTGSERGASSPRPARAPADTLLRSLVDRLALLAADTTVGATRRVNALNELRVELLAVSPRAAAAVARAAAAIRSGGNPSADLQDAATELTGESIVRGTVVPWSGW